MGIIIFNGESSKDYNIEVEHPPKYDFPEEDVDVVHVPGRNGDIIIRKGSYKNVNGEYELSSGDGETAHNILSRAITNWLHNGKNYCRLEDSYDPDIFRLAAYKEAGSIENIYGLGARVTVNFDCKPQRWLKSGETAVTMSASGDTITNPTQYPSLPKIRIESLGPSSLNVNGTQIDLKGLEMNTTSSTVEDLKVDVSKFMDHIHGEEERHLWSFITTSNYYGAEVYEESTGITAISLNDSTFISKVSPTGEALYIGIFTAESATLTNIQSGTLNSAELKDQAPFGDYELGDYILTVRDFTDSYLKKLISKSNASLTVSVDSTDYYDRMLDMGSPENAFIDQTYIYDGKSTTVGWYDSDGYLVDFSDYGVTVTGNPKDKDTITIRLFPTFSVSAGKSAITTEIFSFDGYPQPGDKFYISKIVNKWSIYKNEDLLEDNATLSEYGITLTGTPVDSDTFVITAKAAWTLQLSQQSVDLSDFGISYKGEATFNDVINIQLGQPIIVDSEMQDCYSEGGNSRNNDVYLPQGYPELSPGENTITYSSGISEVEVTPRWWTL